MMINITLSLPLKEEFSLYQKLWDLLDYREKVDKSDTKYLSLNCVLANKYVLQKKML